MHPVRAHINWLTQQVEEKLEGAEVTPESIKAAIDDVCTYEWPRIRARVAEQVAENWRLEHAAEVADQEADSAVRVPHDGSHDLKMVTRKKSRASGRRSKV